MREIKFRAWDLDYNRMDYNFFVSSSGVTYGEPSRYFDTPNTEIEESPNLTLMQYTGLKDKDGVEIYEGDVLRYVSKSNIKTLVAKVEYIEGGFCVIEEDDCYHCLAGICSDERHEGSHVGFVIGNIHQNPELLGDL